MAIDVNQYEKIRSLYEQEGYSIREIARITHLARETVRKYCTGENVPWVRQTGSGRKSVITEEIDRFIGSCLEEDKKENLRKQKHTAKRIRDRIEEELGINIAESTIRKAVAAKKAKIAETFVPLEYIPGEAVQIDWGSAKIYLGGVRVAINYFCMRECSSGAIFGMTFYRQNEESFLEGIRAGLEFFGGVPRKVIFDNGKVGVKEGFGHYAVAQERYAELAAHYAFKTIFCNPAEGHEKGLVENLVGFLRNNCLVPLPKVDSMMQLNIELTKRCGKYNSSHQIRGREYTVAQMLEASQSQFIKLPPYRFDPSQTLTVRVDEFALARFDYNKYSVPFRLSGKQVTVKGFGLEVQIWYQGKQIISYDRCFQRNKTFFRLEHYIDLLERKPRSVWNAKPVRSTVPTILYDFLQNLDEPKQVLKILRAYLRDPDTVMSAVAKTPNYEQLILDLDISNMVQKAEIENEVKVAQPQLSTYDTLLERRAVL